MKARMIEFGELEIEGKRYDYDVIIDRGKVKKRRKEPSKPFREQYGHTPLSVAEKIPWGGDQLIVGTGAHGRLPVMRDVLEHARRRHIKVVAVPTEAACRLLKKLKKKNIFAVLHATC